MKSEDIADILEHAESETWSVALGGVEKMLNTGSSAPSGISGMRVLLAEDSEINRQIVQFVLERAGAKVEAVKNGKAAVVTFAAADHDAFDCVLMDLMMPVMNGLEATRVIRAMDRPDAKTVPVIALSASECEKELSREAGMNEYLSKPVDIAELFGAIQRFRH